MRLASILILWAGLLSAGAAAQTPDLAQFLGLSAAQRGAVQQLNQALQQTLSVKANRKYAVQMEVAAEAAKALPDPVALGQRYIEINSLDSEVAVALADARSKIAALLTPTQTAQVQQIATALVQGSLIADASCAYLTDGPIPTLAVRSGDFSVLTSGNSFGSFLLGYAIPYATYNPCGVAFPVSVRNYFSLTDAEVASILGVEAAYQSTAMQKQNRAADLQVEIRDETAKPSPDPTALGSRYAELAQLSRDLEQADQDSRKAARAFLAPAQQSKLQALTDLSMLLSYSVAAESCQFLAVPPGVGSGVYLGFPCGL